jgi:hypothetical protein
MEKDVQPEKLNVLVEGDPGQVRRNDQPKNKKVNHPWYLMAIEKRA